MHIAGEMFTKMGMYILCMYKVLGKFIAACGSVQAVSVNGFCFNSFGTLIFRAAVS